MERKYLIKFNDDDEIKGIRHYILSYDIYESDIFSYVFISYTNEISDRLFIVNDVELKNIMKYMEKSPYISTSDAELTKSSYLLAKNRVKEKIRKMRERHERNSQ